MVCPPFAGAVAQMFAGVLFTPLDIVKERLQVSFAVKLYAFLAEPASGTASLSSFTDARLPPWVERARFGCLEGSCTATGTSRALPRVLAHQLGLDSVERDIHHG